MKKGFSLNGILIIVGIIAIMGGGYFFIKEQASQNQKNYSYIETPSLQNSTDFSHYSRGYSWTAKIPDSYKLTNNPEATGPFLTFNVDENNPNCNFSVTAPVVEKPRTDSKGFNKAFENYLEQITVLMEELSNIPNFEFISSSSINIGKLTGTIFEYKKNNLHHLSLIAKHSEKELIAAFDLECFTSSEEKFNAYKNEFFGIISSFK